MAADTLQITETSFTGGFIYFFYISRTARLCIFVAFLKDALINKTWWTAAAAAAVGKKKKKTCDDKICV